MYVSLKEAHEAMQWYGNHTVYFKTGMVNIPS